MYKKIIVAFVFITKIATPSIAQELSASQATDTTGNAKSQIIFSGFIDTYFVYDFNRPADNERPGFLFNHKRHNEFSVNLAILKGAYTSDRVRANIGLMAGTYAQYNLAHEQEQLQQIWEANAGLRLSKGLWLDAGIFLSHIGFENAISTENYTLTRSLMAENTPYYLSGAKLTYTPESHPWEIALVVANGWQNIREAEGNTNKAIGTQVTYSPGNHLTINYSTFFSNEYPDITPRWRYLNNFYTILQVTNRLGLIAAFDVGTESQLLNGGRRSTISWVNPAILFHYQLATPLAFGGRVEYYHDPSGIIITPQDFRTPPALSDNPNGFRTVGYSLNLDYMPTEEIMLRVEGRLFQSQDAIFLRKSSFSRHNAAITTSLAINF